MEDKMKFKTNLDCQHCVDRVKPLLDKAIGENNWCIDLQDVDKVLTVNSATAAPQSVIDAVEQAGFDISKL